LEQIVGILGGMGPMATVDLLTKIIQNTPANIDQDHIQIIINNNPKIQSRSQAILQNKIDPLPELIKSMQVLENAGVDFIVIPCNTAHYWINDLHHAAKVPILNMIDLTANYLAATFQNQDLFLILSTKATVYVNLYQKALTTHNLNHKLPNSNEQKLIDEAINKVKAGFIKDNPKLIELDRLVEGYQKSKVTALIGGCTEIPLLYPYMSSSIKKIDPTYILANEIVKRAKKS
jgi:aspartate racemase